MPLAWTLLLFLTTHTAGGGAEPPIAPFDATLPPVRLIGERAGPGTGVTLPILMGDAKPPSYTADSVRERIEGVVRLDAVVREDGTVGDVRVIKSLDPWQDEACVNAVRQWRFQPGTKNGKPVPVIVSIEHAFTLR